MEHWHIYFLILLPLLEAVSQNCCRSEMKSWPCTFLEICSTRIIHICSSFWLKLYYSPCAVTRNLILNITKNHRKFGVLLQIPLMDIWVTWVGVMEKQQKRSDKVGVKVTDRCGCPLTSITSDTTDLDIHFCNRFDKPATDFDRKTTSILDCIQTADCTVEFVFV